MAIVIERTITVKNDKATLDNPLYLYVGDGDIVCLFTIKEIKKAATFGAISQTNLITESASYGEVRIYKPDGSEPVFTTRAEIIDDKLQALFSYEHIDHLTEAGIHQLQIHLYDNDDSERNRFTIPPIELNVLFPVGTGPNVVGIAEVGYAEAAAEAPIDTFLDDGSYNKTTWETGDKITSGKLNKIEEALYQINENGDYVTSQELEVALRAKAPMSHTHSEYALKSSIPTVPTRTSQLTNDSGYVTESVVDNKISDAKLNSGSNVDLSNYATKSDLTNKANKSDIPTKVSQLENDKGYITNATLPTVPTKTSQLTNDSGYITNANIPTKTSQLTNDSGFITSVPSEYITESELTAKNYANKDYVTSAINNAQLGGGSGDGPDIDLSIYATKDDLNNKADISDIPTKTSQLTNNSGFLTSIPLEYVTDTELSAKNYADKDYVTSAISDAQLGGNNVDLSDYATKDDLNLGLSTKAQATHTHNEYALKSSIPAVPTKTSQLANDSGYITGNFFRIEVVEELPVSEVTGVLYIVKKK